ncbi:MAG TPA: SigE family RNA polymerase sigma factor [Candidatus Eisenbacteria bacterium]|nr:SigE family RNA polymerase sigma factor [Candidatus Eisenbacteria bacterium]
MGVDGRDEVFTSFVAARHAALLRTAVLLAGDRHAGEDLLQSVLAKTYVAWPRIREPRVAEAYVRRALVNTATSWWRSGWARREVQRAALPDAPVAATVDVLAERSALWPHLRALPTRQRAVLVLRYYEDLSEAQIADLLGCSAGTVKSQASRALSTLRARLGAAAPFGLAGEPVVDSGRAS